MPLVIPNTHKHYSRFSTILFAIAALLLIGYSGLIFSYLRTSKFTSLFSENTSDTVEPNHSLAAANPSKFSANGWTYNFAAMPNGRLSKTDWNFDNGPSSGNYNSEAQTYTPRPQNVRIEKGALIIEAMKESRGGREYTSARINTKNKFAFTYGKVEVDMKLPRGVGTWPAAWLLPNENKYKRSEFNIANNDPYAWALNGEIDFAESIGSAPGVNLPAAHSHNELQRVPTLTPVQVPGAYDGYHRYGIVKTPGKIIFTLDGGPYASRTQDDKNPLEWPYEQPYYLIINLAIGGSWAGTEGIDDSSGPWQLKIRSISYKPVQ